MQIDNLLVMSSAQAVTTTVASTSYIDTLAAGDSYEGAFVEFLIRTGYTGNSATIQFALETDSDSAFGTAVQLFITGAIADTTLVAGYRVARFRIPLGAKRYLRGKYTVSGTGVAGTIDCRIVRDVDITFTGV